jgi:hypothetical protein
MDRMKLSVRSGVIFRLRESNSWALVRAKNVDAPAPAMDCERTNAKMPEVSALCVFLTMDTCWLLVTLKKRDAENIDTPRTCN